MFDCFFISHAFPSWLGNRWITAMFVPFYPHMEMLLKQRDESVGQ